MTNFACTSVAPEDGSEPHDVGRDRARELIDKLRSKIAERLAENVAAGKKPKLTTEPSGGGDNLSYELEDIEEDC